MSDRREDGHPVPAWQKPLLALERLGLHRPAQISVEGLVEIAVDSELLPPAAAEASKAASCM